jgi:type VI secretion system protein ImpJ
MSSQKVVWSEGMFLHPQHFQQQDKYFHHTIQELHWQSTPYAWGFSELSLDQNLLRQGKVSLSKARGIMPDGTTFSIPQANPQPPIIEIEDKTRDVILHLTVPLHRAGGQNYSHEDDGRVARFTIEQSNVMDETTTGGEQNIVEVAQPNLQIILDNQDLSGFATLPIARIIEKREDSSVILDENFIPCCLDTTVADRLKSFTSELSGMLEHRAESLAGHVSDSNSISSAEFADYLMLMTINRYGPLIIHLDNQGLLHPHALYKLLLSMAGELATFSHKSKRPQPFPPYEHEQLQETFAPLMASLRVSLSKTIERNAIELPLDLRSYGIRVAAITDRSLVGSAQFVLAAKAELESDRLRQLMPNVCKVSSVEEIRQLVNLALSGIRLIPLPVAPPQIPYHAGYTYFELDRSSDHWSALKNSGGFALHVGEGFPGLELKFWAIRE